MRTEVGRDQLQTKQQANRQLESELENQETLESEHAAGQKEEWGRSSPRNVRHVVRLLEEESCMSYSMSLDIPDGMPEEISESVPTEGTGATTDGSDDGSGSTAGGETGSSESGESAADGTGETGASGGSDGTDSTSENGAFSDGTSDGTLTEGEGSASTPDAPAENAPRSAPNGSCARSVSTAMTVCLAAFYTISVLL